MIDMAAHSLFNESGQLHQTDSGVVNNNNEDIPDIFDVLENGEDEGAVKYLLGFGSNIIDVVDSGGQHHQLSNAQIIDFSSLTLQQQLALTGSTTATGDHNSNGCVVSSALGSPSNSSSNTSVVTLLNTQNGLSGDHQHNGTGSVSTLDSNADILTSAALTQLLQQQQPQPIDSLTYSQTQTPPTLIPSSNASSSAVPQQLLISADGTLISADSVLLASNPSSGTDSHQFVMRGGAQSDTMTESQHFLNTVLGTGNVSASLGSGSPSTVSSLSNMSSSDSPYPNPDNDCSITTMTSSGSSKTTYACWSCSKEFTTKFNLKRHINLHCNKSKLAGVPIQGPPSANQPTKKPTTTSVVSRLKRPMDVSSLSDFSNCSSSSPSISSFPTVIDVSKLLSSQTPSSIAQLNSSPPSSSCSSLMPQLTAIPPSTLQLIKTADNHTAAVLPSSLIMSNLSPDRSVLDRLSASSIVSNNCKNTSIINPSTICASTTAALLNTLQPQQGSSVVVTSGASPGLSFLMPISSQGSTTTTTSPSSAIDVTGALKRCRPGGIGKSNIVTSIIPPLKHFKGGQHLTNGDSNCTGTTDGSIVVKLEPPSSLIDSHSGMGGVNGEFLLLNSSMDDALNSSSSATTSASFNLSGVDSQQILMIQQPSTCVLGSNNIVLSPSTFQNDSNSTSSAVISNGGGKPSISSYMDILPRSVIQALQQTQDPSVSGAPSGRISSDVKNRVCASSSLFIKKEIMGSSGTSSSESAGEDSDTGGGFFSSSVKTNSIISSDMKPPPTSMTQTSLMTTLGNLTPFDGQLSHLTEPLPHTNQKSVVTTPSTPSSTLVSLSGVGLASSGSLHNYNSDEGTEVIDPRLPPGWKRKTLKVRSKLRVFFYNEHGEKFSSHAEIKDYFAARKRSESASGHTAGDGGGVTNNVNMAAFDFLASEVVTSPLLSTDDTHTYSLPRSEDVVVSAPSSSVKHTGNGTTNTAVISLAKTVASSHSTMKPPITT